MPDSGTLATVAAITAGFGIAMLFFRIERELSMQRRAERIWVPWVDWLLIAATLCSVALVLLPLILFSDSELLGRRIPTAGCATASVGLGGYVLGILAHYRLLFARGASGPRHNPEPSEKAIVVITTLAALLTFTFSLIRTA